MSFRVDVPMLLTSLSMASKHKGREWFALCPNPGHDDSDPSWRIVDAPGDKRHGSHKCWSCGFSGGPWELASAVLGISLKDAGEYVQGLNRGVRTNVRVPEVVVEMPRDEAPEYTLPNFVQIPSLDGSTWFTPALKYLQSRAVPPRFLERWDVGFALAGECAMRIVIPVRTSGRLVSHVARTFTGRTPPYHVPKRGARGAVPADGLFGEPGLDMSSDYVIVVEGIFKKFRLDLAGAQNVVAVLGASNLTPSKVAILSSFARVIVAQDPDAAGDAMVAELRRGLGRGPTITELGLEVSPDDAPVPMARAALRAAGLV